jgi:uncharacterized protein with GYD domain
MENNIEQMKQDVRTYIALGMNWADFHVRKIKGEKEKRAEKLTKEMNEFIFEALDNIDYFEKTVGRDIFEAIAELDEEEKQFVIHAKELRAAANQNKILPKGFDTSARYVRNDIERIKKAKEQLNLSNNEDIQKTNTYIEERYINLGRLIQSYSLQPYIDRFTDEEQQYIEEGRMAKLKSEYTEGAEKARKFLATSAKFKKVGNSISQVGVDFNKAMTTKGEEMGDKVRQAGVKLSPLIIDLGEDVIELADKIEEKGNLWVAKMQFKKWRKNVYNDCLETAPGAPEYLLEQKFKETFNIFRSLINERFPIIEKKIEEFTDKYKKENQGEENSQELENYLHNNVEEYREYKYYKEHIDFCNMICKYTYEELSS